VVDANYIAMGQALELPGNVSVLGSPPGLVLDDVYHANDL
jgi:hypothetical protein